MKLSEQMKYRNRKWTWKENRNKCDVEFKLKIQIQLCNLFNEYWIDFIILATKSKIDLIATNKKTTKVDKKTRTINIWFDPFRSCSLSLNDFFFLANKNWNKAIKQSNCFRFWRKMNRRGEERKGKSNRNYWKILNVNTFTLNV